MSARGLVHDDLGGRREVYLALLERVAAGREAALHASPVPSPWQPVSGAIGVTCTPPLKRNQCLWVHRERQTRRAYRPSPVPRGPILDRGHPHQSPSTYAASSDPLLPASRRFGPIWSRLTGPCLVLRRGALAWRA